MMYVVYFESCGGYFADVDFGRFDSEAEAWERAFALEEAEADDLAYDEGYIVVGVAE
jgi:hypothetical protein